MNNIGRNAPCPCGSGKKYKKCCLEKKQLSGVMQQEKDSGVYDKESGGIFSNLGIGIVNAVKKWQGGSSLEVKCNICGKKFNRQSRNTFESIEKEGKRIYFCPECNINLSCSSCKEKLGSMGFDLYSCNECGGVFVICINCGRKNNRFPSHAEGHHQ